MHRSAMLFLCFITIFADAAHPEKKSGIAPVHIAPGTILTFHLQTRLNPGGGVLDTLPRGTALLVKMLDSIDSDVDRDGREFRGSIVSSVVSGNEIVVHPHAQVHGLLALLRSRSHPDGFRYELLLTGLTDHGKAIALTASLNPSFSDISIQPDSPSTGTKEKPPANEAGSTPVHP
jgi:hypothetical protein